MTEFSLDKFRDFINSVSDEIFMLPEPPKEANLLTDEELEKRVLQIIAEYPDKNTNHVGPRFNAICNECKAIKAKERVRVVLQKIYMAGTAAQSPKDGRWYIMSPAKNQQK